MNFCRIYNRYMNFWLGKIAGWDIENDRSIFIPLGLLMMGVTPVFSVMIAFSRIMTSTCNKEE